MCFCLFCFKGTRTQSFGSESNNLIFLFIHYSQSRNVILNLRSLKIVWQHFSNMSNAWKMFLPHGQEHDFAIKTSKWYLMFMVSLHLFRLLGHLSFFPFFMPERSSGGFNVLNNNNNTHLYHYHLAPHWSSRKGFRTSCLGLGPPASLYI